MNKIASPIRNYEFTRNWTKHAVQNWNHFLSHLSGTKLTFMEIGVFEGRFACWLLDRVLTHPESRYIGIDDWSFSYHFYTQLNGAEFEARARHNLANHQDKSEILAGPSQTVLRQERWNNQSIDVGYIDGNHQFGPCLEDSVLMWPLIKPGGLLIWDDYTVHKAVRHSVDAFLRCIEGTYTLLFSNRQIGISKNFHQEEIVEKLN